MDSAGPSNRFFTSSRSPSSSLSPPPPMRRKRIIVLSDSESDTDPAPSPKTKKRRLPTSLRGGGRPRPRPDATRRRLTRASARRGSTGSLSTSLEEIAEEHAAVTREIARLGLGLRDVQGDGNCLFRAVSDQLWGTEKRHGEVRKLVCDYLEVEKEAMEMFVGPFLKDDEGYEGYVERMRMPKQFGSHIEIQAAARVFKRNIRVIMSTASFTIPWQTESSSTPILSPQKDTLHRRGTRSSTVNLLSTPAATPPSSPSYATALAEYIPHIRPGRSMLWLSLFSQAEHFQSIRKKGDGITGAAEVEDRLAVPHELDTSEAARRERGELDSDTSRHGEGSSRVAQVMASLPPGHGITVEQAAGILARVKGDLGEAVEILLEAIDSSDSDDDGRSDRSVEGILRSNSVPEAEAYRTASPANTSTSSRSSSTVSDPDEGASTESKVTTPSIGEEEKGELGDELEDLVVVINPDKMRRPQKTLKIGGVAGAGKGVGRGTVTASV